MDTGAHYIASSTFKTVSHYEAVVSEMYGPIAFDHSAAAPFVGEIQTCGLGWMQLSRLYTGTSLDGVRKSAQSEGTPRNMLLILSEEGPFSVSQFGRKTVCNPGSLVLVDTGAASVTGNCGESRILTFRMPSSIVKSHFRGIEKGCGLAADGTTGCAAVLRDLMLSIWRNRDAISKADLQRLPSSVLNLIGTVFLEQPGSLDQGRQTTPLFESIKEVIDAHLQAQELNTQDISRWLGVSKSYIYATTKRHGTTLGELIIAERLERCRSALADPAQMNRTIIDVALAWGFQNPSHFSRRFRDKYGESPSEFKWRVLGEMGIVNDRCRTKSR